MAEKPSLYVADAEKIVEMVRLAEQDQFITDMVSGLLPPAVNPVPVHHVLDVGCGPGGWAIELAKAYPAMQVTGIDISEIMIDYASKRAIAEGIENVDFQVMDFQQLAFADASFDLVNARLILWFLQQQVRDVVLQEWFRVVQPGGSLRLIEVEVAAMTNSLAFERVNQWFISALVKAGKTVSSGGRFVGTSLLLRPMLHARGCQDIQERAHLVNFSAGTAEHRFVIDDFLRGMETMTDFILKTRVVRKKQLVEAQEQVKRDLDALDFLGILFYVSAWGRKPANDHS